MSGIKAKRKQLVRKTLMRAKAQGERTAEQRQESPEEYAQTEVQQGISDVAARTGNTAKSTARMSYRKFRAMQEKRNNLTLQGSAQSASKPTEKEKVTVPTQAERREMFKKQRFRQKAIAAKTPAPQAPVPSSATPAPPPYQAQMQQHLKRQHLTREAVRRYLQKQTATTAAGNTAPIVTHAPKLPTISNKQATVEAISRGVHYIAAKIKALLSQTVRRAAQSLLALLGAGDPVLQEGFLAAAAEHPGKVGVQIGYHEAFSHRIMGGADVILVPSRFEPCGLTQLYGLKYGTLPLVRRTGGLADTVADSSLENLADGLATGFVFEDSNALSLLRAIRRAFVLWSRPSLWRYVQRQAMNMDFSWQVAANSYRELYQRLM